MDSESIIALIGGLGIGSGLTSALSFYLNSRMDKATKQFEEKKAAYLGLLESLHKAAVEPSNSNAKNYGFWSARISLVGSPEVVINATLLPTHEPDSASRIKIFDALLNAMRADLKIDERKI